MTVWTGSVRFGTMRLLDSFHTMLNREENEYAVDQSIPRITTSRWPC
jgi:hypothetical protein